MPQGVFARLLVADFYECSCRILGVNMQNVLSISELDEMLSGAMIV